MSRKRKNKNKKKKHHDGAGGAVAQSPHVDVYNDEPLDTEEERLSKRGIKTIAGGIGLLLIGFYVLTLTDPHGRNWASTVSPLLILGAYAVIGFGIFLGDPEEEEGEKTEEASSAAPKQPS
ncbi:MAG: hypothetical protein COB53_11600 [Elusimicrobia bacterium]|nr:MAG: hypothetical protein COB53_11600 [Elusimicrobiota bacterium]